MPTDKTYEQGGAATEDGNYPRENGIGSAYLRLQVAERDMWPGGRGRVIGSRFHERIYQTDETNAQIARDVAEAEAPLVQRGLASAAVVTTSDFREGAVGFVAEFTDLTTGDSVNREVTSGAEQ
jgi:hypothetical protein